MGEGKNKRKNKRKGWKEIGVKKNLKGIVQTLEILQEKSWKISNKNIEEGLLNIVKNTGLKGRWQTLSETPIIVCDTGHNHHGISIVIQQIAQQKYKKLHSSCDFDKYKVLLKEKKYDSF